jgi:hypothetical protein
MLETASRVAIVRRRSYFRVKLAFAECTVPPEVPENVTVYVPSGDFLGGITAAVADILPIPLRVTELGVVQVDPTSPVNVLLQLIVTTPVNPLVGVTVMVNVALFPGGIVNAVGETEIEKSFTVSVKVCIAFGFTPFCAVKVML